MLSNFFFNLKYSSSFNNIYVTFDPLLIPYDMHRERLLKLHFKQNSPPSIYKNKLLIPQSDDAKFKTDDTFIRCKTCICLRTSLFV